MKTINHTDPVKQRLIWFCKTDAKSRQWPVSGNTGKAQAQRKQTYWPNFIKFR